MMPTAPADMQCVAKLHVRSRLQLIDAAGATSIAAATMASANELAMFNRLTHVSRLV